jgi:hypothetical protein
MSGEHEAEAIAASIPDDAQTKSRTDSVAPEDAADSRTRRIMEYLRASLDQQDALRANLCAANADLMMIAYKLAAAIKSAMAGASPSLEAYEDLVPAIGNLLRIHKQVDRFSALETRLTSAKAAVASLKGRGSAAIGQSEELKT